MRKSEKVENGLFYDHLWINFGYASHIPALRFRCITHLGLLCDVN